ncbi:MAG: hypothetical protein ACLP9Y_12370 [Mycobacterium sp.]
MTESPSPAGHRGLTAQELRAAARLAAVYFDSRHVGYVDVNSQAVPVALFGAAAGIRFVPLNYSLPDEGTGCTPCPIGFRPVSSFVAPISHDASGRSRGST